VNLGKIESNKKSPIGIVDGLSTNLSFNTSNSVKINLKISHLQKAPSVVEKLLNLFK
jgi:hypothetical protein